MPPIKLNTMREHIAVIRDLLSGGEATYHEGEIERSIKFLHPDSGYINVADPIPIHMASNGPKALKMVGELADGWVTIGLNGDYIASSIKQIKQAAKDAGRAMDSVYTTNLTSGCVLRSGESMTSPRVLRQI